MTDELTDEQRVEEGLRLENNGIVAQRVAAILDRVPRHVWVVEYRRGIAASMRYGGTASRV